MSRSSVRSRLCRIEARLDQIIGTVPCRHCGARGPARLVAVYGTETPNVDPCPVCARPVLVLRTWIPRNPCDPPLPDQEGDDSSDGQGTEWSTASEGPVPHLGEDRFEPKRPIPS